MLSACCTIQLNPGGAVPVPLPVPFGFGGTVAVPLQPTPVFGLLGERDTCLFRGPAHRASERLFLGEHFLRPCHRLVGPCLRSLMVPYRSYVAEGSPPQPANRYAVKELCSIIAQLFYEDKSSSRLKPTRSPPYRMG